MITRFEETVGKLGAKIIASQDLTTLYNSFEQEKVNWEDFKNTEEELILKKISSKKLYKEQNESDFKHRAKHEKKEAEIEEKKKNQMKMDEISISSDHENSSVKLEDFDSDDSEGQGDPLKVIVYEDEKYNKVIRDYEEYSAAHIKSFLNFCEEVKITEFYPMRVIHCPQSHGISITNKNGWKLSYSGDCIPSKELVAAGQNSTLLIHEATFSSDQQKQARGKMHSTVAEAVGVAKKMQAKRLLLTHFSQRFNISEKTSNNAKQKKVMKLNESYEVQKFLDSKTIWAVDH